MIINNSVFVGEMLNAEKF